MPISVVHEFRVEEVQVLYRFSYDSSTGFVMPNRLALSLNGTPAATITAGYRIQLYNGGDRLPYGWYASPYVVYDYAPYRLYAPPYGYHWVRVGNDVILTAIATGIVLDVIYNIWY